MEWIIIILIIINSFYLGAKLNKLSDLVSHVEDNLDVTRARILSRMAGFLAVFKKAKEIEK